MIDSRKIMTSTPTTSIVAVSVLLVAFIASAVDAQDEAAMADPIVDESQGINPIPDYSGDFWHRNRLTGDWGGARTDLADFGIQFDVRFTQTMQSVVDGGLDTGTRYGGSVDYLLMIDLMRMGLVPGGMIKFRGESRYGQSVNDIAGSIIPANTDALFPLGDGLDDDIPFVLTNLAYYQFLSEKFGVFFGKIDTLDGDLNEFASGRGTTQFMNGNFTFPTSPMLAVPYSTLGAGVIWVPIENITVTSTVINTSDSSTTTGFEDFGEGTSWLSEVNFQYRLFDLPGGQNVGFMYAFDNEFFALGERFVFVRGQGLIPPTTDDTWAAYWSAWQYVWVEDPREGLINLTDGRQDLQGVGLFGRIGFADEDTNPLDFTISGGIGARGVIPNRDDDTMGIAYYYSSLKTGRLSGLTGIDDEVQGFEAYYNLAITPAAQLTFDVQVIDTPRPDVDAAVILGLRLNLDF